VRLVVALALVPAVASAEPMGWWASAGPVVGVPLGDFVDEGTSWGLALDGGDHVSPHWGVVFGYHRMAVSTTREYCAERYTLHNSQVVIGARYSHDIATRLTGFVDGELHLEFLKIDHPDFASSDMRSTPGGGIGVRAGILVAIADHVLAGAAIGASTAKIELGGRNVGPSVPDDFADRWLTADAFVQVAF
jgi:hypothetical protein